MALKPGFYPPAKFYEPKYATPEAKTHAEQLEHEWKERTKDIQTRPVKRQALL